MVDENGRQTITNDGATVMKVCMEASWVAEYKRGLTNICSSSTSSIPLPASSSTLHGPKTPKWATEQLQSSCSLARS